MNCILDIGGRAKLQRVIGSDAPPSFCTQFFSSASTSSPVALFFSAAEVRVILHDSCLFRPEEVERWSEPITPCNLNSNRWILEIAKDAGLAGQAGTPRPEPLDIIAHLGHYEPFKWGRIGKFGPMFLEDDDD
jgi:hypothetical protein